MISTFTSAISTSSTLNVTTNVEANIPSMGIFAIIGLLVLLISRDILMVEFGGKINNEEHSFILSYVNSSVAFIIPLIYVFLSIIAYKIIVIV
ncbi:MAG: hypothetical protein CVT88_03940 [Candidatus Altiarchaeales archaeon HGW-Altiarchaeales-1]|nr:MAG: hypothetical protein CVT88_03940 [Candidatus Altiarchaeales archaeon HGW-Altiarchaeales-1]